jgi:AraC-like DNA-binding protein
MSTNYRYHQFKAVTALSPLQFQKRLRLQEARHLLLGEHLDAASAGSRVGYADAGHFSRDYERFFDRPPDLCGMWHGCAKLPANARCKRRPEASN